MVTQTVEWIRRQLRHDPRLRSLPQMARADAAGEILTTIYLRKLKNGTRISSGYVARTARFQLQHSRRGDAYVEKLRRLAEERQRKGMPIEASLLEQRPATTEPIDYLVDREDQQLAQARLQLVHLELQQLSARSRAVIKKFLIGRRLTHAERAVYSRTVAKLRFRLVDQISSSHH